MFGRYDVNAHCSDENDPENWSFPMNYERFSTVNAPKSRLGKRRTVGGSSDGKRDVLKALTAGNGLRVNKDFQEVNSQGSCLTHPVSAHLTPNHKLNHLKKVEYKRCEANQSEFKPANLDPRNSTPCRKENYQHLKEIKTLFNDENFLEPKDSSQTLGNSIKNVLNQSFELTEGINEVPFVSNPRIIGATNMDTQYDSDLGNNSSFMTAHDIYNPEKSRLCHESVNLKTPQKGFSLFDMLASPADPLSNLPENDNLKNILAKTPSLNKFDSYKTPFKPQARIEHFASEMFTPSLKNIPKTPIGKICNFPGKSPFQKMEPVTSQHESSEGQFLKSKPTDTSGCVKEDGNETYEILKQSPTFFKRQIFEGFGWSLPQSSFPLGSAELKSIELEQKVNSGPSNSPDFTPVDSKSNNFACVDSLNICCSVDSSHEMEVNPTLIISQPPKKESALNEPCVNSTSATFGTEETYNVSSVMATDEATSKDKHLEIIEFEKTVIHPKSGVNVKSVNSDGNADGLLVDTSVTNVLWASALQTSNETFLEEKVQNNDSRMCCDETESCSGPNSSEVAAVQKEVTIVEKCADPNKQVTEVPKLVSSQERDDNFIAPQSALHCPNTIKPQNNVVYVKNKPYTVLSTLGRGGSSEVYQVLEVENSKLMAMKFVNLSSVDECIATGYLNEVEVLSKLQGCPSVIRMFDSEYIPESKILYVIMEKGDTDFSRLMKEILKTKKIPMSMIIYYWTEMLSCVKDIHEKGIIHSDLKPANFLLVAGRLKLIDFGIASSLQGDMTSVLKDVTTGTFNYMSPEAIRNSGDKKGYKITYKSDIWSLGCILYNLLYGKTPFSHLTHTWTKLVAIANSEEVSFPSETSAPPHLLYSVRWALRKDPKERPTANDLLRLAEMTPSSETPLGRQISSLLAEYISQIFPDCRVKLKPEKEDKVVTQR